MPKPVLLTVDDDPEVLRAIERDLRSRYADRYRVMRANSGSAGLTTLRELKARNNPVALLLADQRMPQMDGVNFLSEAMEMHPLAKRALLTAYADTNAAIDAINEARVHYYLMKPWDPPEEKLFPALDDLLHDWTATFRPPYEGIRVLGTRWSTRSYELRDFLARNQVPYQWIDVELAQTDPEVRGLIDSLGPEAETLPLILFPDGARLAEPPLPAVADKIGLRTHTQTSFYDLAIVGGGPAGLAAAVYGASEGLHTVMIEREAPAGQAGMHFAKFAVKVVMLVRGESLASTMSHYLIEQIEKTPNIEVQTRSSVVEVHGESRLTGLTILRSLTGEKENVPATSLYIFIGAQPRTEWLGGLIERDERGFILSGPDLLRGGNRPPSWTLDRDPGLLETNVPGIFVVGDVRHGSVKRVASGVGEGAVVVQFMHQYLAKVQ